jgi:epoxyqueuosine reductase
VEFLEKEAVYLENWLKKGYHGKMHYMENHFDKRTDPRLLVPGAKSVIVLAHNYFPEKKQKENTYLISKYAYGEDYHFVLKRKLFVLVEWLRKQTGDFSFRVFTDSAPVLEKELARRAGLGWIGKNSLLLQPGKGSYFFLAEIISDLDLIFDSPALFDRCGRCTKCIDACPTDAILPGRKIDASKCISYLTIELRDEIIPREFQGKWKNWIFGCDICQDVCPWNSFSLPTDEPAFRAPEELLAMHREDWENLSKATFKRLFKKSAISRSRYKGLMRNIRFLKKTPSTKD